MMKKFNVKIQQRVGIQNHFFQDIIQYSPVTHNPSKTPQPLPPTYPLLSPLSPTIHAPHLHSTNLISPLASRLPPPTFPLPPTQKNPTSSAPPIPFHIPAEKRKRCTQTPLSAHARFARHTPCLPIYSTQPRFMDACMHPTFPNPLNLGIISDADAQ